MIMKTKYVSLNRSIDEDRIVAENGSDVETSKVTMIKYLNFPCYSSAIMLLEH